MPPSAKNENGPTWTQAVQRRARSASSRWAPPSLQGMKEGPDLQVGVAPIPGLTGGSSSFVGGDVLGISANSKNAAQAWDFIAWTLSEEAQVEVVAKNKNITVRTDLADNKYAKQDPRLATFNKLAGEGQTPISVNFGKTYNDPNGPWTATVIDAVFGTGDAAAGAERAQPGHHRVAGQQRADRWWSPARHAGSPRAADRGGADPRRPAGRGASLAAAAAGSGCCTPPRWPCIVVVLFVVPLGLMVWMSFNHWPLLGASSPERRGELRGAARPAVPAGDRVHAQVHGGHHGRARPGGVRAGAAGAAGPAGRRLLPHRLLPARPRSAWPRPACCSTGCSTPSSSPLNGARAVRSASAATSTGWAPTDNALRLDGRHDHLAVRRLLHAHPDDRAAEHRPGAVRGGAHRRREPAGRSCGGSRCRCCGRRSR